MTDTPIAVGQHCKFGQREVVVTSVGRHGNHAFVTGLDDFMPNRATRVRCADLTVLPEPTP